MNNLNETFSLLLKEYQKTGSLEKALKVLNLSPEQRERVQRAFQTLDKIETNAKSLRKAKEEGISRKNWIAQEILTTAKENNLSEEETEKIYSQLSEAASRKVNRKED